MPVSHVTRVPRREKKEKIVSIGSSTLVAFALRRGPCLECPADRLRLLASLRELGRSGCQTAPVIRRWLKRRYRAS